MLSGIRYSYVIKVFREHFKRCADNLVRVVTNAQMYRALSHALMFRLQVYGHGLTYFVYPNKAFESRPGAGSFVCGGKVRRIKSGITWPNTAITVTKPIMLNSVGERDSIAGGFVNKKRWPR